SNHVTDIRNARMAATLASPISTSGSDIIGLQLKEFFKDVLGLTVEQSELSRTKPEDKSAYISCKVKDLGSGNFVHWYQQKDGEALKRILYVNKQGAIAEEEPFCSLLLRLLGWCTVTVPVQSLYKNLASLKP
ncbi:hypothetical protein NFI96_028597, partial [Prochilodus magdalenae]